jgi:phospholipase/carboxylesterase
VSGAPGEAGYHAARSFAAPGAPVVFTFHGTGGDERQFHDLTAALVPGARIVSPRGDVDEMGHLRFFRRTGEGVYDMEDLGRRVEKMADFLAAERGDAPLAAGIGYSNGANILAATAFVRPELIDVMVLMHPLIPWTPAPQPGLAGRRVLITAGRRDPICPPQLTQGLADWFADQEAEITLEWHPGGHEVRREEVDAAGRFLSGLQKGQGEE